MLGINFDENTNLEEDIKNSRKNYKKLPKLNLSVILVLLLITTVKNPDIVNYSLVDKLFFSTLVLGMSCCITSITNIISEFIFSSANKQARDNLEKVVEALSENNIHTNTDELSNSIIIKNKTIITEEIENDEATKTSEETIKTTYYLYLDDNSKMQGLLEKRTINLKDYYCNHDETEYYTLEEPELKTLENKVTLVKKLVKKTDYNSKKM